MADPTPDIKNPLLLWFAFIVTLVVQMFSARQAFQRWRSSPPITRDEFEKFRKEMESQRTADQTIALASQQALAKTLGDKMDELNRTISAHVGRAEADRESLSEIRNLMLRLAENRLRGE